MTLSKKKQQRVAELNREIYELEHSGEPGTFCSALIPLYQGIQELYAEQEAPPEYSLNCDNCGEVFLSEDSVPSPYLCPKCKKRCQLQKPIVNPVIVQLKRELSEAWECELTAGGLHHVDSVTRWVGYQDGLRRAIKIVEGK